MPVDRRRRRIAIYGRLPSMKSDLALERLGGVADIAALLQLTSRARVRVAVRRGTVVKDGPGRYSLPGVEGATRAANRLSGVLVEDSAAQYYGWAMKLPPRSPCLAVPRNRNVAEHRRRGLRVRFVNMAAEDVNKMATCPGRTVTDCSARMPFDEALSVADSALRGRDVNRSDLIRRAEAMPDRYRARCLRVARAASEQAANPFESVLRAIALDVVGLAVEPQVWVDDIGRPDLVDQRLRLVAEADSFEFHGRRRALTKDCERYNAFVIAGWLVIRFAWEHVMFEPDYVRQVLTSMVALLSGQPIERALASDQPTRAA